ncbi:MAG TPA: exonuclease domain-containing protein, partial [Alphaproteobacteria bacterium]|nr:exonuclease domain-containing protein [Alphaproteobacteria bacterium]
ASFDVGFVNAELTRHGFPSLAPARVIDTLAMARRMFPGAPASLDALCKRFDVDLGDRALHGALLDARLLAEVYLELRGGRQPDLVMAGPAREAGDTAVRAREFMEPRPHAPTEDERAAHDAFLGQLKDPLWRRSG